MGLLKTLAREEILEVLSEGLCRQCQPLLEARIHRILNSKKAHLFLWIYLYVFSLSLSLGS